MNKIKLIDAKVNTTYTIKDFELENSDMVLFLNNLGIKKQEKIVLRQSNYGKKSYLVNVSGVSYGLDERVCKGIIVE